MQQVLCFCRSAFYLYDSCCQRQGDSKEQNEIPEGPSEGYIPRRLTTPIAYITRLPKDIYPNRENIHEGHPEHHPPHYSNDRFNQFWYDGPDSLYVARLMAGLRLAREPFPWEYDRSVVWMAHSHGPMGNHNDFESEQGYPVEYDPTNGTISDGDIFYFGPGRGFTN